MLNKTYKLRYLPLFYVDLEEKILYIANELKNPAAAEKLLGEVEQAIKDRLNMPEAYEPYESIKGRKHRYYRIYVDNFVVYYVVIDEGELGKYMEVRRLLYKGQNRESIV